MRLNRLIAAGVLVALPAAPLSAQLRASRPPPQAANLPRLMVANPHSFSSQDSTASVRIGQGMRERIDGIADRWYKTLLRNQMNEALQQYAYPIDAVLPPMVARQLATSLNARAMIVSTILKGEANRYTVETRLIGVSDDAGQMVRLTQLPNESFESFGARVADALVAAFKALPDARACENQSKTAPDKAVEAAGKAIKNQPNSGLAHYCLAHISIDRKLPVDSVIAHLKVATQGDPLSLPAWNMLSVQYQAKRDSAATIETFQQLLRVAPTNEPLRKEAFGLFQRYGRPDAAENVADEGIKLDPANADMWDLKFGACIAQEKPEKNRCALDALEKVFELDSTKADTTFFTKITYAASRPIRIDTLKLPADSTRPARDSIVSVIDTARFVKWSQRAVEKYPTNAILIGQLAQAYSVAGPLDSAVAATKRLMAVDSSDITPLLRVAKALSEAKRGRDALDLVPYVERLGSADDKQNMAAILGTGAFPLLQPPPDYLLAADMARAALKLAPPNTQISRLGSYLLGLALFQQVLPLDDPAVKTKSCPISQQMKALLDEAGPALQAGRAINEGVAARYITGIEGFTLHVNSMIKAYCK